MSPAERARQIDKEEFAAECAAIRQRAYAVFDIKPPPEKKVREWIARVEPKRTINPRVTIKPMPARTTIMRVARPPASNAKFYTAFGKTLRLKEWAAETGISHYSIRTRLNLGWTVEDALTRKVQKHANAKERVARAAEAASTTIGQKAHRPNAGPGVPSDFAPFEGTGAGSTLQETPNITFSGNDA
jgi:hypothetical protein